MLTVYYIHRLTYIIDYNYCYVSIKLILPYMVVYLVGAHCHVYSFMWLLLFRQRELEDEHYMQEKDSIRKKSAER